jgi:hypothetical protein
MTKKDYMLPSYGYNHVLESAAERWTIRTSKNDKTFALEATVDDSLPFVGVSQSSFNNIAAISELDINARHDQCPMFFATLGLSRQRKIQPMTATQPDHHTAVWNRLSRQTCLLFN